MLKGVLELLIDAVQYAPQSVIIATSVKVRREGQSASVDVQCSKDSRC